MSRAPRKPMPPSLSDKDIATMKETASQGGLGSAVHEEQSAPDRNPAPAEPQKPSQPEPSRPAQSLRPYVAPNTELAKAVQEAVDALSPETQRFVQPSSFLREFLQKHDLLLAQRCFERAGSGSKPPPITRSKVAFRNAMYCPKGEAGLNGLKIRTDSSAKPCQLRGLGHTGHRSGTS